ncbi:MAG: hypothetical protein AAB384_03015 [Patescibacteria group bacterium]
MKHTPEGSQGEQVEGAVVDQAATAPEAVEQKSHESQLHEQIAALRAKTAEVREMVQRADLSGALRDVAQEDLADLESELRALEVEQKAEIAAEHVAADEAARMEHAQEVLQIGERMLANLKERFPDADPTVFGNLGQVMSGEPKLRSVEAVGKGHVKNWSMKTLPDYARIGGDAIQATLDGQVAQAGARLQEAYAANSAREQERLTALETPSAEGQK